MLVVSSEVSIKTNQFRTYERISPEVVFSFHLGCLGEIQYYLVDVHVRYLMPRILLLSIPRIPSPFRSHLFLLDASEWLELNLAFLGLTP